MKYVCRFKYSDGDQLFMPANYITNSNLIQIACQIMTDEVSERLMSCQCGMCVVRVLLHVLLTPH